MRSLSIDEIDFGKGGGLVPVIAMDSSRGKALMLAYANREAVELTLASGFAHYFSRSRGRLWKKGEESGHTQRISEVRVDCDRDALIYNVDQTGPACHTGEETCFFTQLRDSGAREYDSAMASAIVELLEGARVAKRGWVRDSSRKRYDYLVNPITEGIPPPSPEMLGWISEIMDRVSSRRAEKIVTFEALGVPFATLLAQKRKKRLVIARKRDFHSPRELFVKVPYASGFERGEYFFYGLSRGDRVLLVDDMVSTGGSLIPTIKSLRRRGVKIMDAVCVVEKPAYGGGSAVEAETGLAVKTLFELESEGKKVVARPTKFLRAAIGS